MIITKAKTRKKKKMANMIKKDRKETTIALIFLKKINDNCTNIKYALLAVVRSFETFR